MPSSPSDSDHRDVIKMPQLQASSDRALAEKLSSSPSPASFKAPFDWMFASACTGRTLTEIQWMNKDEAIRATLAGNEQGVVDLWRLRELSLSPGGLLSPSLRKRAWPMLTGCHEQILQAAAGALKPSTFATPSFHDMISLKNDVSKTIWNVEEHLIASREEQRLVDEELQYYRSLLRYASKKVSFAPILTSSSPDSSPRDDNREYESDVGGPPDTIFTSTTSEDEIDLDVESVTSSEDAGISPVETTGFSSPVNRWREASDHEQKILYNVILSVLRTEPEPSEYFEDDQYRFYPGLQDLCALMMINLESPSLTSLVLANLAPTHLRDSLREKHTVIDTMMAHCFMPLLKIVDEELFLYLQGHGITLPSFCRPWLTCWFAQDVPDVEVASRLLDAFLISHPLMPLYVIVALLTGQRQQILNCASQLWALDSTLQDLPVTFFEGNGRMDNVETALETALAYMKQLPPTTLVGMMKLDSSLVSEIAVFRGAPKWSFASQSLSDFALLQKASSIRNGSVECWNAAGPPSFVMDHEINVRIPSTVAVALGIPPGRHRMYRFVLVLVFGLVCLLVAVSVHTWPQQLLQAPPGRLAPKPVPDLVSLARKASFSVQRAVNETTSSIQHVEAGLKRKIVHDMHVLQTHASRMQHTAANVTMALVLQSSKANQAVRKHVVEFGRIGKASAERALDVAHIKVLGASDVLKRNTNSLLHGSHQIVSHVGRHIMWLVEEWRLLEEFVLE